VTPPKVGDVVPFSFLWADQHAAGEDAGRKVRPCVVVAALQRGEGPARRVAVAPITSVTPKAERFALELPGQLKRKLELDAPRSCVICDEFNYFIWPGPDLERSPTGASSYGQMPKSMLQKIREFALQSRKLGAFKLTDRD
jgi:hypothetical protein